MIHAVGDRVIVILRHEEKQGKIFLPEQSQEYNADFYGEVVAIGDGVLLKDEIDIGDKILYFRHEGYSMDHDGTEYLSIRERHILGKYVEEK